MEITDIAAVFVHQILIGQKGLLNEERIRE
jgi:hypothetical protein